MIPSGLLGQTALVERIVPTTDAYGNTVHTVWTTVATVRCRTQQLQTSEVVEGRDTASINGLCVMPAGTDVHYLDRLVIDGQTWQVDGEPNQVQGLGRVSHVEATITVVKP